MGSARAQQQLKLVLLSTLAVVMPHAGVVVPLAAGKFDGRALTDEPTRRFLAGYLEEFAEFARRFPGTAAATRAA